MYADQRVVSVKPDTSSSLPGLFALNKEEEIYHICYIDIIHVVL